MKLYAKKQQGMTLISILCIGVVLVTMFLLALKILPIYIDNGKITSALESIQNNPEAKNEGSEQLTYRLFKLLQVNNADTLITKENVEVSDEDGFTKIRVKYEVKKNLFKNASILVEFDDSVEIR